MTILLLALFVTVLANDGLTGLIQAFWLAIGLYLGTKVLDYLSGTIVTIADPPAQHRWRRIS